MNVMPISEIIEKVTMICKKNNVKRLDLFGSFATGTATPTSDIDFVVYGCDNLMQLEDDLLQIETLRKIDIPFPDTHVSVPHSCSPQSRSPLPALQKLASGKIPCGWH